MLGAAPMGALPLCALPAARPATPTGPLVGGQLLELAARARVVGAVALLRAVSSERARSSASFRVREIEVGARVRAVTVEEA